MALTISAALIRDYCRPVASDTTNWPNAKLESWWDRAFYELRAELCPPFIEAQFDALNTESGDHPFANQLIAQFAAMLIYRTLPGKGSVEEDKLQIYFYGTTEIPAFVGMLQKLATGEASLFAADGARLSRTSAVYHSLDGVARDFSRTRRDLDGSTLATGTLDQFD